MNADTPPPLPSDELDPDWEGDSADASDDEPFEIGAAYIGTVLDERYVIREIIGHGGMGTVFRGEQILMQKRVAIKLLHADLAARKQVLGRFTREARAISRLSSPHTIRVFDFGRWRELFFLVMEFLQGETLDAVLLEGPMAYPRVADLVLQMCDSLGEAHAAGVVHRDLKPENVFLTTQDGREDFVKILDFGLAKVKNSTDIYTVHSQSELFGTPYYMSPEQIKAGEVDGRSDIYSVGALMFRMLTGQYPHGGDLATFEILKAHLMNPTPKMADVAPGVRVAPLLEGIVAKCLAKKPDDRFQTMAQLAAAITDAKARDWQGEVPPPAAEEEDAPEQPLEAMARQTTRWRLVGFVAAIVLLLAVAAALLASRTAPAPGLEVEPNDDARHPNPLSMTGTATGGLGKRRSATQADQDCFQLPKITSKQTVSVIVTGLPNMDLRLALHDRDGDPRLSVDHRGRGQGELLRLPDPRLPVTAVCVTEALAQNAVASESLSDQYRLQVTVLERRGDTEQEPNDLAPGETLPVSVRRAGSLEGPKDRDVFRLEGAVDGRLVWVTLELQENPAVGVQFALLDQAGRTVASRGLGNGEVTATLGLVPLGDQIPDRLVLFRQGARDVPLPPDEVTYHVQYDHRDAVDLAEVEPNNAPPEANPLALGVGHVGSVEDDADWLRVDGGDPSLARVRLEAAANGSAGIQLTVRDVGQQVDLRTLTVQPGQPQDLVISGSGEGLLIKIVRHGKGEAKWLVRARYLPGVVTAR